MSYASIEEIKKANVANGGLFFSEGAMRFFKSRISKEVIGGCLFVTSESFEGTGRRYTIRRADPHGEITTVGAFQQYASRASALAEARRIAACVDATFEQR